MLCIAVLSIVTRGQMKRNGLNEMSLGNFLFLKINDKNYCIIMK